MLASAGRGKSFNTLQFNFTGFTLPGWQTSKPVGMNTTELDCNESWRNQVKVPFIGKFCEAVWDGFSCWPDTLPNQTVDVPCSRVFGDALFFDQEGLTGFKTCSVDGEWVGGGYTNYSRCILHMKKLASEYKGSSESFEVYISYVLLVGSIVSAASLIGAISAYVYVKSVHVERLKILVHMMIALFLKSILWIIIVGPGIFPNLPDYRALGWTCNAVISLHLYAQLVAIFSMLIVGHYLSRRSKTVAVRIKIPRTEYLLFCWVAPVFIIALWATMMILTSDDSTCWNGYSKSRYFWIVAAAMLGSLLTTLFYLIILVKTVAEGSQCTTDPRSFAQIRNAKRDICILFSLVGMNNFLVLCNPWGDADMHYRLFQAIFHSLQGSVVAGLCCFVYENVNKSVSRKFRRAVFRRNQRQGSRLVHFA